MSYTAKNLDEIADLFIERANAARERIATAPTKIEAVRAGSERTTWSLAADILRRTTLTEPCHMEPE